MFLEISNPMNYHVGLYIRLSKEDENEGPSESVNNQKSLLEEFVERQHLCVYDTYIDDGWSGTNFDRPDFKRLIGDIEAKKVNMVITKDLSRLGRDYILTGHYMERYFPEHHVRYISLLDGIDTGVDSTANDITPFRAIMNDMYAKDISKKIKSVKHDKQRKGLFIGGKPMYGYKMHPTEKNKIVIDEEVAPIVRRIFSMALAGISGRQIAAALNDEKIPPPAVYAGLNQGRTGPYAGLWSSERIAEMLQNETYIGNMVQGRSKKISYKSKMCVRTDRKDWVIVENTHEPLVSKEAFEKVQLLIQSRRYTRSRTYDFLLKGLIFCHECGYPLAVVNRKKPNGEDCLYFLCRTYQRFTKSGACTCHAVKEEKITQAVLEQVNDICRKYVDFSDLTVLAEREIRETELPQQVEQEMTQLKAKIQSLSSQIDKVYFDRLSGLLTEEDFARIYQRMKDERTRTEQKLSAYIQEAKSPADQKALAKELAERFLSSTDQNRELLVSLVERVEFSEDKQLYIHFRFPSMEAIL
ncbi:MAG TPA: recombinase family protein [Firmicutes bacterium]|nr:recombinase family protein [Bacillota bacterium]